MVFLVDERYKNLIQKEFDPEEAKEWFSKKQKKFLHNIDTFYYSVKLLEDFTLKGNEKCVRRFRTYLKQLEGLEFGSCKSLDIPGTEGLVGYNFGYSKFYKYQISYPDFFDIFVAPVVPPGADGGASVTSEFIVQIRSYLLWLYGPQTAFRQTFGAVQAICGHFGLTVSGVKENRIDYCWHSNYLESPERFFQIDRFNDMQVSHFRGVSYHYTFKSGGEYENDYVALGKRSDKVFVRIYLKSKEVVEMGYKPWFLKLWYDNQMISKYDFYCFEYAYLEHNWKKLDVARLKFYSEYGADPHYKLLCSRIVGNEVLKHYDDIAALADLLTPRVTSVMNVEFQTMRRGTKSYVLVPFREYADPLTGRVDMYFDNWEVITEYLTHSVLRLTDPAKDPKGSEVPKGKRDYCPFWKLLRAASCPYMKRNGKEIRLIRDYSRKLNSELVKRKMLNNVVNYNFYRKGINDDDPGQDCMDALLRLNDNDLRNMSAYKLKRKAVLNSVDFSESMKEEAADGCFAIFNQDTGEVFE